MAASLNEAEKLTGMQVLIVHNILNDSFSISGVLKEYAHMANAWTGAGHQTDFVAAKAGWPQLQKLAPRSRLINSDGIFNASRFISRTWLSFPAYAYRMLTAHYTRLPAEYDIVYASSPFIVEVYAAMVLASRQRAKLVVKVQHLLAAQSKRSGFTNRLLLGAERMSTKLCNRHADLVLCLSKTVGRDYQAYERSLGLTPKPMITSGCGIDVSAFANALSSTKEFDVVFLGRMHQLKGVFEIPAVWKRVLEERPTARLFVIGEGPHRIKVEKMCRELGLMDSVKFTGAVSEEEKIRLLTRSRIGLSLSYEEGWGLSVTEFLAAGLPVVAYDLPVFAEIFPGQLETVLPHDHQAAASKILALLEDEPRREALARRGKEFVARYDFRAIAESELVKLSELLG
jgi:glycosyltransferase involved in cell wall biosynthesis